MMLGSGAGAAFFAAGGAAGFGAAAAGFGGSGCAGAAGGCAGACATGGTGAGFAPPFFSSSASCWFLSASSFCRSATFFSSSLVRDCDSWSARSRAAASSSRAAREAGAAGLAGSVLDRRTWSDAGGGLGGRRHGCEPAAVLHPLLVLFLDEAIRLFAIDRADAVGLRDAENLAGTHEVHVAADERILVRAEDRNQH